MPPTWTIVVLSWNGREDTLACLRSLQRIERPDVVGRLRRQRLDGRVGRGGAGAVPRRRADRERAQPRLCGRQQRGHPPRARAWRALGRAAQQRRHPRTRRDRRLRASRRRASARRPAQRQGALPGAARPNLVRGSALQRPAGLLGPPARLRAHRRTRVRPGRADRARRGGADGGLRGRPSSATGLLDEDLFAYIEDVDWSLRVRAAGFEVLFVPGARAWHAVGGSTGGEYGSTQTLYYGVRNTVVVCERHRPLGRLGTGARRGAILASYLALVPPRRPWRRSLGAVLEGFRDARARPAGGARVNTPERIQALARNRALTAADTWERHLVVARLAEAPRQVVDVGGLPGQLRSFLPGASVVAANIEPPADLLVEPGALPFRDRAIEVVTSLDALEHVPPPERAASSPSWCASRAAGSCSAARSGRRSMRAPSTRLPAWYRELTGGGAPVAERAPRQRAADPGGARGLAGGRDAGRATAGRCATTATSARPTSSSSASSPLAGVPHRRRSGASRGGG